MVYIIAEVGVNHNGSLETAMLLARAAKKAGANAVKFQLFHPGTLEPPGKRRNMLMELELTYDDHYALKDFCEGQGTEYLCTPFDVSAVNFLAHDLQVKRLKISSGDLGNTKLLMAAVETALPVILSTGMATEEEIFDTADLFKCEDVSILHCVSAYPADASDMNLNAITGLLNPSRCPIGLSDHTTSTVIPAAAVALGATIIEKHITFSRYQDGPDHKASIRPPEFARMVENIREVEVAMGDGQKHPVLAEIKTSAIVAERKAYRQDNAAK